MLRAIIVDDEILVRATLEKMVDWAAEGFQLAGCYANGQAALEAMERCPADLVFTDIKMPVCSGLEFIDGVHALGLAPHIVVLSAFDEFPLVKQAFKKGAADYVLKQEIVPARMLELVREARAALCAGGDAPAPAPGAAPLRDTNAILQDVIFHNALPGELSGLEQGYVVACFFLDEIYREMARLGTDVNATLTQPLTKLVMQMPQFRSTDGFYSFDMSGTARPYGGKGPHLSGAGAARMEELHEYFLYGGHGRAPCRAGDVVLHGAGAGRDQHHPALCAGSGAYL